MIINNIDTLFEVNTSESYNKEMYFFDNHLIIPYINLEIFDISSQSTTLKKSDKLDFSYLIFKDVKEIFWKYAVNDKVNHMKLIFDKFYDEAGYSTDHIEAINIFTDHYGFDFEIRFKEQYLYFSEDVGIKNGALNYWTPIELPNFKRDMNEKEVQSFFAKDHVPPDTLNLVGARHFSMLKTLDF
ncbi:hypothetical protein [Chryseobacterium flavum]|uniref:hypothetical protein n=1 Tax=Chryseobacterium flavum TaxID=415851 RepID=UPI0028AAFFBF|nr:hypothetical protein [Chryseobacterium flavum]